MRWRPSRRRGACSATSSASTPVPRCSGSSTRSSTRTPSSQPPMRSHLRGIPRRRPSRPESSRFLSTDAEGSARELVRTVVGQHGGFERADRRQVRARRLCPRAGRSGCRGRCSAGDGEPCAPRGRHQLGRSGRHGRGVYGVGRPGCGDASEVPRIRARSSSRRRRATSSGNAPGHDRGARPGRAPSDGPHGGSARVPARRAGPGRRVPTSAQSRDPPDEPAAPADPSRSAASARSGRWRSSSADRTRGSSL